MNKSPILDPDGNIENLTDEELLRRIRALDPDEYPLAAIVDETLEGDGDHQEGSS